MKLRRNIQCLLLALSVSAPGVASATGILTFDTAAMENALQELAYWEKQVTEMKSQLEQQTQIANRMTSQLKLATSALTDYDSLLPDDASDLLSGQSISKLKSTWGLVSSNTSIQASLDKDLEVTKMLHTMYDSSKERAANLNTLRSYQDATDSAAEKADYQNRIQTESADIAAQQNQIVLATAVAEQERKLQSAKAQNTFMEEFYQ